MLDKTYAVMPETNQSHLRLYGHYMCPFVERVRLVLAAKNIPYQDCQVNLEKRTKWHYDLNDGFVPILELSNGELITESAIIMSYLDSLDGTQAVSKSFADRLE